jgi:uncharacterized protein (TIGR02001 family)
MAEAADDAAAPDIGAALTPVAAFNGDLDIYSDYIARGLTYNHERVALQARLEYDSPDGPYAGFAFNHNSVVGAEQSIECDPYVGFVARHRDLSIDVGAFAWIYPGSRFAVSRNRYDTLEGYVGAAYKTLAIKFWYEFTNYFGLDVNSAAPNYNLPPNGSSRGSHYLEANVTLPLPRGISFNLHAGRQFIRHYDVLSFTDWRVGLEAALGHGFSVGAARTDTNADATAYTDARGLNLARGKWLAYVRWAFP